MGINAVFAHRDGVTRQVDRVDPAWIAPDSGVVVWVDLSPSEEAAHVLHDVFHFHDLAIEDALSDIHFPKIESYGSYLYLVLHGIDFEASVHRFATHDTDFFLGPNYLVTVHDEPTRSILEMQGICVRNERILSEGPASLLHRLVDAMVDHYRPEVDKLDDKLDEVEKEVFSSTNRELIQRILDVKKDVASLRRVMMPQRDILGRLGRREFGQLDVEVAYRFRDVYDHVVRITDEALIYQDRITGILDAHLANVSNRLNEVMKVLTVIATIFMPMTVLTGMYGMNVPLPHFPGGEASQFWWIGGIMLGVSVVMLAFFRRRRWI